MLSPALRRQVLAQSTFMFASRASLRMRAMTVLIAAPN